MNEIILHAETPSCVIQYSVQCVAASAQSLKKYQDTLTFNECCRSGCPNYGLKWSCPPYAPEYENFVQGYRQIIVLMLKAELSQFSYIKNNYLKIKAANSILKSRIDKTLRYFKTADDQYISTGSCRLCKPCKKKLNYPCAHPDLMAYSFEALGIDVSKLVKDLFDMDLLWYSKNNLPQYTCVVGGVMCNNEIPLSTIIEVIKNFR